MYFIFDVLVRRVRNLCVDIGVNLAVTRVDGAMLCGSQRQVVDGRCAIPAGRGGRLELRIPMVPQMKKDLAVEPSPLIRLCPVSHRGTALADSDQLLIDSRASAISRSYCETKPAGALPFSIRASRMLSATTSNSSATRRR